MVQTTVGVMIFLAYATTPAVARLFGAGEIQRALGVGRDGLYVAASLGAVLAVAMWATAPWLAQLLGTGGAAHGFAVDYIRWSAPGIPAMLMILAATGVLRGFQDTKTPLVVSASAASLNVVLNFLLVYGAHLSVAGAALGTSIAQWTALSAYLTIIVPRMKRAAISLRPSASGMRTTTRVGSWLFLRTIALRASLLITVWVAARSGETTLAAHQIVFTLFSTLAFALDALAIAAQAMVGHARGAGRETHPLIRTFMRWALGYGVLVGGVLAALSPVIAIPFTRDPAVRDLVGTAVLILAAFQIVAGLVFVLDGIMIGQEDMPFLALTCTVTLAIYTPLLLWLSQLPGTTLYWIWLAFGLGFLGPRAMLQTWRITRPTTA
ncbi:putative efflux protein, MATE family [Ruaniaceae bacterium KH17]|nr:putative efflux protein, MATE family [Ruaniaceae bacterium KH17]